MRKYYRVDLVRPDTADRTILEYEEKDAIKCFLDFKDRLKRFPELQYKLYYVEDTDITNTFETAL